MGGTVAHEVSALVPDFPSGGGRYNHRPPPPHERGTREAGRLRPGLVARPRDCGGQLRASRVTQARWVPTLSR